ncbi:hypothetical protein [Lacunimicrobium album]
MFRHLRVKLALICWVSFGSFFGSTSSRLLAQPPLEAQTPISVQTHDGSFSGRWVDSGSERWIGIQLEGDSVTTWIPVDAIVTVRSFPGGEQPPLAIKAPEFRRRSKSVAKEPGLEPIPQAVRELHVDVSDDHAPAEIRIEVGGVDVASEWRIEVAARVDLPEATLEVVLLGGVNTERLPGFIRARPRQDTMLRLPARAAFSVPIPALAAGQTRTFKLPVSTASGEPCGLLATLSNALPAHGEPAMVGPVTLYESSYALWQVDERGLSRGNSLLDVRIESLLKRSQFQEAADTVDKTIDRLRRAGAAKHTRLDHVLDLSVLEARGASAVRDATNDAAPQVTVRGVIRFTDVAGTTHPVPHVRVELWDENLINDTLVAHAQTDANGHYEFIVPIVPPDLPDLYVLARAENDRVRVREFDLDRTWAIDSLPAHADVPANTTLTIDLTASNDEINLPSNAAFEVFAATDAIGRYVVGLGQPQPRRLTVQYPRPGDASDYLNDVIRLGGTDAHDWDNIHHEYGHHLQAVFGMANSPGGPHLLAENLCNSGGKSHGVRLAWGEAWPTFFSIMMHRDKNLSILGIPNLGDTRYTDTKPNGVHLEYDLESAIGGGGFGEGNEVAVQRVLWDCYDAGGTEREMLALPPAALLQLAISTHPSEMSTFIAALSNTLSSTERQQLGMICTEQELSPTLQSPADGFTYSGGLLPTFAWSMHTGCSIAGTQRFRVRVFDSANVERWRSPLLQSLSMTPTPNDLQQIFGGPDGELFWSVDVEDANAPATGPYQSESHRLVDAFTP